MVTVKNDKYQLILGGLFNIYIGSRLKLLSLCKQVNDTCLLTRYEQLTGFTWPSPAN